MGCHEVTCTVPWVIISQQSITKARAVSSKFHLVLIKVDSTHLIQLSHNLPTVAGLEFAVNESKFYKGKFKKLLALTGGSFKELVHNLVQGEGTAAVVYCI